ncbi:Tafazzin [Phytophthora nicotianae]|uniref:Tafazzin n=1 Tax=Phytophthora nicotianae TaxID=4792 RepID=A0A0W8CWW9_PHYNI|nr:Tafazzin [Phytophthora nicotianae]
MNMTLVRTKMTALPLLATPPNWNRNQRDQVSIQVLQEFEKDAYVLVCNIPGPVHLRYLYFLRRLTRTLPNGKRKVLYVMIIASSKANERTRLAEDPQDDVEWVSEGGTFLSLTEVDDGTVSFSYDHWTSCKDDHHAQSFSFNGLSSSPDGHNR